MHISTFHTGKYYSEKRKTYPYLWEKLCIIGILNNMAYLGYVVNGKTTRPSFKSKKVIKQSSENFIIVPNKNEAIISQEVFDLVQERRKHRRRPLKTGKNDLFSGFLFCGTVTEECIMCVGLLFSKNIFTMFAVAAKSILSNAVLTMSEK